MKMIMLLLSHYRYVVQKIEHAKGQYTNDDCLQ